MKKIIQLLFLVAFLNLHLLNAQSKLDELVPVRGIAIASPGSDNLDRFIKFINEVVVPNNINTLILRVDYKYEYKTHPELRGNNVLKEKDVKKLVQVCKKNHIEIIPQINLLGHQSWQSKVSKLLEVYPQFDETPHVKLPEKYEWPNDDGLYCKSYCPLHPDVHGVVFDLMDEICDVFEAKAFHAGMDEVFYIADDNCPRCSGRDKAELFAAELTKIKNHLELKDRKLWIWGDRLIDGKTTGLGMWEASMNNTHRAIDIIPKDIVICDWHYERADQTAVYFAMKGFNVVTCPWRTPEIAKTQLSDILKFRENSTPIMKNRFQGMILTIWSGVDSFLDEYYGVQKTEDINKSPAECFRVLFKEINNLSVVKE